MLIFAIETSCDETSAAVIKDGRTIISDVISSQIDIHRKYSGVVPELAGRAHIESINAVIEKALKNAGISFREFKNKVAAIAYTRGPGLSGSLLVGQVAAQALSIATSVPAIDVNHIEGHMHACLLEYPDLKPPYLALTVSGGHTELTIVEDYGKYKYLGGTRDDAAGEAFDKVARLLGLAYPGGPVIDALARKGDPGRIHFTRPYLWGTWDFSFSGIKTAVVNEVKKNSSCKVEDICASFQAAVVETIVKKTIAAASKYKLDKIVVGGGVAANSSLRFELAKAVRSVNAKAFFPSARFCTDNAAMIACAAFYKYKITGGVKHPFKDIDPGLTLKNWKKV